MMVYRYRSRVLDRLGVRSWINAKNWATIIGGTWIDDRVLEAMNEVAKTFVDMFELFAKADERVARLCKVEDAHITSGTGAAMELSVAGCMAGDDYGRWMRLPDTEGMRNEVVNPRGHYIAYTPQWTASGARLVEYGPAGALGSMKRDLEAAITDRTCCLSHTLSYNVVPRGVIPWRRRLRRAGNTGYPSSWTPPPCCLPWRTSTSTPTWASISSASAAGRPSRLPTTRG